MTHLSRPAIRRSVIAMSFASLMTLGTFAPAMAQSAPAASAAPVTASVATASVTTPLLASVSLTSSSARAGYASRSTGQAAANRALSRVGARYQWGATGSNAFDCSGLTSTSWAAAGVNLPRTSRAQANTTRSVSRSNLQPGDLVFFGSPVSHVEMYIGDGKLVGASRSQGRVATSNLSNRSNIVGYGRP